MGVQCMTCTFVSFTVSTSKLFYSGRWRIVTNSRNSQAHILLFWGDLSALCVASLVFAASLPSFSLQTLLHLSCWLWRRAGLNQSKLQNHKRAHHDAPSTLPPLLLRRNWHLVKKKLSRWTGCRERKQRNTRESSRLGVQSGLPGLCSSVTGWHLSMSSPLANGGLSPSDNAPLCSKGEFRITNNNNGCRVAGDL